MRLLLLLCLCLFLNACNKNGSYNPGYVISESQETAVEEEITALPSQDD